ncbi:MAG: J domain-containing protein [Pseudonocardia sp.]|nr:J domain-containing protein [Pseudonocardia sp.]
MTRGSLPPFDLYDELEVAHTATPAVIEAAYRALVKRHHPDVASTGDPERIKRLNVARDWLLDPSRRARYDGGIGSPPVTARAPEPPRTPVRRERPTKQPEDARPTRPSSATTFGPNSREVRLFLAELRELDSARADALLRARSAVDATAFSEARSSVLSTTRVARSTEWAFARDAASVIAKGKLADSPSASAVASMVADIAGAIVVRDLILPSRFVTLLEPWTQSAQAVSREREREAARAAAAVAAAVAGAAAESTLRSSAGVVTSTPRPAPNGSKVGAVGAAGAVGAFGAVGALGAVGSAGAASAGAAAASLSQTAARAGAGLGAGLAGAGLAGAGLAGAGLVRGAGRVSSRLSGGTWGWALKVGAVPATLALVGAMVVFGPQAGKPGSAVAGLTFPPTSGLVAVASPSAHVPVTVQPLPGASASPDDPTTTPETPSPTPTGPGVVVQRTAPPQATPKPTTIPPTDIPTTEPTAPATTAPSPTVVPTAPPTPLPTVPPTPVPTGVPTAPPTPVPTATPAPPVTCTVPNLIGSFAYLADNKWADAGFTGRVDLSPGSPPWWYVVDWQSRAAGTHLPCTSGIDVHTAP